MRCQGRETGDLRDIIMKYENLMEKLKMQNQSLKKHLKDYLKENNYLRSENAGCWDEIKNL